MTKDARITSTTQEVIRILEALKPEIGNKKQIHTSSYLTVSEFSK